MLAAEQRPAERMLGRYALFGEIASGGMATVHFGRLQGPVGFSRTVAIKRLHPQYAKDPEFASMFLDEARVAARIQHPNVVATLDVVPLDGELFLVMEYVQGEALAKVFRTLRTHSRSIPLPVVGSLITGVLYGLHSAHEARSERGDPLHIVHRDVSPQNILVGSDGVARVLDFGVAKAAGRVQITREGQIKGKIAYMAPEQLRGEGVDRRADVYGAAVVLWEALCNRRLFEGDNDGVVLRRVLDAPVPSPSAVVPSLPPALDEIVHRGLSRDPAQRYQTAREMAVALEDVLPLASPRAVGEWVEQVAGESLARRAAHVKEIESISSMAPPALAADAMGRPSAEPSPTAPSQVSGRSVVQPAVLATPPPRRRGLLVALIGAAATLGVLLLVFSSRAPATSRRSEVAPANGGEGTAPPPKALPRGHRHAGRHGQRGARGQRRCVGHRTLAPRRPPVGGSPRPRATTKPASPPSCTPPYTVDASGIRRIKPECL
ncbi:MAG: protein kinase [Polyangiaceae bacterium]